MRLRYLHIPDLPPLKNVSITFGHEPVLGRQCTIHFIVGVNGTGKSRLLRAIVEIFLALKQADVPPFPVAIAYDLGRSLPGQESSQAVSTIYYYYGGHGKSSAYMVVLDHIPLHVKVDWEHFHKLPWKSESAVGAYRKRRYLRRDDEERVDNLPEVTSYLPTTILAYTSGSAQEWMQTFNPPPPSIEERLALQFLQVKQDIQERRQDERPPYWNSAAEARYQQQQMKTFSEPFSSPMLHPSTQQEDSGFSASGVSSDDVALPRRDVLTDFGIFIQPETLKLVVCAVALTHMLDELGRLPTEQQRQKLERQIEEAVQHERYMGGLRDLLNAVDWLWPISVGLRIALRPEHTQMLKALKQETELLTRLYLVATSVVRECEPEFSRTLFFDLPRVVWLPTHEKYHQKSTLEALNGVLGGENTRAFDIFKQLQSLQQLGMLEDITIALQKRHLQGIILYDWLSDGERMFLGRMALFHLLQGIDDTLIVLDEPETHFNDIWKREVVDIIDNSLRNDTSEIIISTHSSIALTDAFDTEITQLQKHRDEAGVYATRPMMQSFGSSPNDILRDLFGASESIGQRASEFLDFVLLATTRWTQVQDVLAVHGTDEQIRRRAAFRQFRAAVQAELDAYKPAEYGEDINPKSLFELDEYILQTLRAIVAYTYQQRSEVNPIAILDVLEERLGPGYYQFEFRRRLRALRKDSNAT